MPKSHVQIVNATRAPISLPYVAEDQVKKYTTLVTLEGNYVPVEHESRSRKVMNTVVVPPSSPLAVGKVVIPRETFLKLDKDAIKVFGDLLATAECDAP